MSESVLYNQEVTADILNNIAVDLGNVSFEGFGETKFGANELNAITASLVSKGILTSDNKCKPILNDLTLSIQTGTMVFENGAKKKLEEVVNVTVTINSYVYALNNTVAGTCEIIVSETDPVSDEELTGADYIPIASIDENGALMDMRIFSSAKVQMPVENMYLEQELTCYFSYTMSTTEVLTEIDVNHPFRYVWVEGSAVMTLEEGKTTAWCSVGSYERICFKRTGTKIELYGNHVGTGSGNETFTVYLA